MPKEKHSQPVPVAEVMKEAMTAADPNPSLRLLDVDKLALDLARSQRQTALAEAKAALAQNEKAELAYKYVVLQLYMKYGLTEADAISENGEIIKGGAIPRTVPNAQ